MPDGYTLIIPAYNAAATITEAIGSAQRQTRPPARILVVDDGSADDTASVAAACGAEVLRQANQGPGAACNRALTQVETDLIAFLDADDLWLPDKIERQQAAFAEAPDLDAVFGHLRVFQHGRPVDPNARTHAGWGRTTLLMKTASARKVGPVFDPPKGGRGDMVDWIARGREMGQRFLMLDEVVALRRIIATSMSHGRGESDVGYLEVARRALARRRAGEAAG